MTQKDLLQMHFDVLNLQVGDQVQITHRVPANYLGVDYGWNNDMDRYIGRIYKVKEIHDDRVYIDGAFDNSNSIATSIHSYINRSGQTDLQWTLGGGYYSSCYTINAQNEFGMFACYNKTLSADEISSMYNNTKTRFQ